MNPEFGQGREHHWYAAAWATSLLAHGMILTAAMVLVSDLHLAPQPEPFHWDVSMIESPTVETPGESAPPAAVTPTPVKPQRPQPVQPVSQPTPPESRSVAAIPPPVAREPEPPSPPESTIVQSVSDPAPPVDNQHVVQIPEAPPASVHEEPAAPVVEPAPQTGAPPVVAAAPMPEPEPPQKSMERLAVVEAPAMVKETAQPPPEPGPQPAVPPVVASAPMQPPITEAVRPQPPKSSEAPPPASKQTEVAPVRQPSAVAASRMDYGWLAQTLWKRVVALKRYPVEARMNRQEGKVVLRAVITNDGHLQGLRVHESSGHAVLDQDAMEIVRKACPLHLDYPLGRPEVVMMVPISYTLND